jgi:hypothetical protein
LRASDIGRIAGVFSVCLTFTGKGMKGDRLVSNVVHEMGGEGEGEGVTEGRRAPGEQTGGGDI